MGSIVNSVLSPLTGADRTRDAANAAADQQRQAGITAANISGFRPVGMTTRFGTSQFTREIDPATGTPYISSAGYTSDPQLSALQDQLFGQFGNTYGQSQQIAGQYAPLSGASDQLFNLGQQYLATSPAQAAQDYYNSQQGLLSSGRAAEDARLATSNFGRGTGGLGVQTGTGSAPANPAAQALYNARAQQDMALAAQADQYGMQRTQYGAGLYGTGAGLLNTQVGGQAGAYAPLNAQLGLSGQIENMAMQPYNLGMQLGQAQQAGQAAGAQSYYGGQAAGANTQYQGEMQANQANSQFLSSLIGAAAGGMAGGGGGGMLSSFGGLGGAGASSGYGMGALGYGAAYGINPMGQQAQMLASQWS